MKLYFQSENCFKPYFGSRTYTYDQVKNLRKAGFVIDIVWE